MPQHERFAPTVPPVLLLTAMVFFALMPRLLLSPLLLRIADGLQVDYQQASSLFLTGSLGFVLGLLVSGFLAKRLGHFTTILGATTISGCGLVAVAAVHSISAFHLLLVVIGFANGLYPGSGIASVSAIVPDNHRGKAFAIHESGPNLAFVLAPLVSAVLAPLVGWKTTFVLTGGATLAAAAAFSAWGERDTGPAEAPNFRNLRLLFGNRTFWIIVGLFTITAGVAVGVYSVLPTFLIVQHQLAESAVNTIVGVSRTSGFLAIFVVGTVADRIGFRPVGAAILIFSAIMTVAIGLLSGTLLVIAVFLQPLIIQSFFALGLSVVTQTVPPSARNIAAVVPIVFASFFGSGVTPRLFGLLVEIDAFAAGFIALGAALLCSTLALRWVSVTAE